MSQGRHAGPPALCLILAAAICGCASVRPKPFPIDVAAGLYHSAELTYRIGQAPAEVGAPAPPVAGQQVAYQPAESVVLPNHLRGRLTILYPHPDGRTDYAQASLAIDSTDGRSPPQTRTLDIPKSDLDNIIGHLSGKGFFTDSAHSADGPLLTAALDGSKMSKAWTQVSDLNVLAAHILQYGKVESEGPAPPPPASLAVAHAATPSTASTEALPAAAISPRPADSSAAYSGLAVPATYPRTTTPFESSKSATADPWRERTLEPGEHAWVPERRLFGIPRFGMTRRQSLW